LPAAHKFLSDPANEPVVAVALRTRAVETALYDLFGKGKLHGTIHTCLGQEFSGAMLARHLAPSDFVTSNHRCHGHFIGATGDWRGLIDELVGNRDGVCAGIGSSQHLWARNFLSNGQQGGLLPVAAGVALDRKVRADSGVVVSFIGEGTLGEGILYETMNLAALWRWPAASPGAARRLRSRPPPQIPGTCRRSTPRWPRPSRGHARPANPASLS
jgi:2-oxoisovalerate dehydrogenase E1 component